MLVRVELFRRDLQIMQKNIKNVKLTYHFIKFKKFDIIYLTKEGINYERFIYYFVEACVAYIKQIKPTTKEIRPPKGKEWQTLLNCELVLIP